MPAECPHTSFCTASDPCPQCTTEPLNQILAHALAELVSAKQDIHVAVSDRDLKLQRYTRAKANVARAKTRYDNAQAVLAKHVDAFARGDL